MSKISSVAIAMVLTLAVSPAGDASGPLFLGIIVDGGQPLGPWLEERRPPQIFYPDDLPAVIEVFFLNDGYTPIRLRNAAGTANVADFFAVSLRRDGFAADTALADREIMSLAKLQERMDPEGVLLVPQETRFTLCGHLRGDPRQLAGSYEIEASFRAEVVGEERTLDLTDKRTFEVRATYENPEHEILALWRLVSRDPRQYHRVVERTAQIDRFYPLVRFLQFEDMIWKGRFHQALAEGRALLDDLRTSRRVMSADADPFMDAHFLATIKVPPYIEQLEKIVKDPRAGKPGAIGRILGAEHVGMLRIIPVWPKE